MVAVNDGGEGQRSDIQSVTLRPGQVTGLALTRSNGWVTLNWNAVDGATSYLIYRALGPAEEGATPLTRLTTTPDSITINGYNDRSSTSGQTYRYQVIAVNGGGEGAGSDIESITLRLGQAELTLTRGNGQVTLSWNAVDGADAYRIYRADGPAGPSAPALTRLTTTPTTITTTSYINTGLARGSTYRYQVAAVSGGDEGARSAVQSVALLPSRPSQVTELSFTRGNDWVTLHWSAVDGADSYRIYRDDDGSDDDGDTLIPIDLFHTATSYIDASLARGRTYRYQVAAVNDGGEGARSAVQSPTLRPVQVMGLSLTRGNGQVTLNWSMVGGADAYRIYRDDGSSTAALTRLTTNPTTITATSYIDTGLTRGLTYRYQVVAVNDGGAGDRSTTQSITLLPSQVMGLSLVSGYRQITLHWSMVDGADSYRIYRAAGSSTAALTRLTTYTITATSYIDTGLARGSAWR